MTIPVPIPCPPVASSVYEFAPHHVHHVEYSFPSVRKSTNNALEAFNGCIKMYHTLRERLPVGRFLETATTMVINLSRDLSQRRIFQEKPSLTLPLYTKAHQLQCATKGMVWLDNRYFFPAGEKDDLNGDKVYPYLTKVEGASSSTFDYFTKSRFSMWCVTDESNKSDVHRMWCTCPSWLKKKLCKHVIALSATLRIIEIPEVARRVPIGQKRKRGRPSLAAPALVPQ